jgi:hypothetical protein
MPPLSIPSRALWRSVKLSRTAEFKRAARTARRLAVISGRAVAFSFLPSILVDSAETRRLPDFQLITHDVQNAALNLLVATSFFDFHVSFIKRFSE